MRRQPELIMTSVTKALALASSTTTPENAWVQTPDVKEEKAPEYSEVLIEKNTRVGSSNTVAKRARYRTKYGRNFLGLVLYYYSEWQDQATTYSTSRGRSLIGTISGIFVVADKSHTEYQLRLKLPTWLLGKAWELHVSAACSGWKTHLKQYAVVPKSSPVFERAVCGNIDGLKKLFSQGVATPYTMDEKGNTLIHHVSSHLTWHFRLASK